MSILAQGPGAPSVESIRAELDAVLASPLFARAPSLAQFLSYVCRKTLSGEADQIKEYSIAVEALGRPADFDQKADAIVRVEAHRLRKRLKQFYETAGPEHTLEIAIPPGQYVPIFVPRSSQVVVTELPPPAPAAPPEPVEDRALAPVIEIVPVLPVRKRRFRAAVWIAITVCAAVSGLFVLALVLRGTGRGGRSPAGLAAAGAAIRIACGDPDGYVDSQGNAWLSDRYYLGGAAASSPRERILRTRDPELFQNRREGDFRYRIPLEPGVYELRLHFAERVFGSDNLAGGGETTRLFHVFANGVPLSESLDVISDAAGSNTADVRIYTGLQPGKDGFLDLHFSAFKETAFVNGIEVLPGLPDRMRPIRIVAGDSPYRDRAGNVWSADNYWLGGQVTARPGRVSGADDPALYRSERYGHFSYAIPVAPGRYTVNLHFAEASFGAGAPAGGGDGSRVFDVTANGIALLRGFDIHKAAGGPNRAVIRSFHGLVPNAQGKLLLSFVPVVNYACLNAIEVTAEGQ